jgi:ADP-ribose pyrophosphatase
MAEAVPGRIDVIGSRSVFRGRVLEVVVDHVRLPDGRETTWEIVRHPGAAAIVPIGDDGRVLLVRQSRHTVDTRLLEVPAGKLDRKGEDPAECARRELQEETGYRCGTLEHLGTFLSSPGFSDEVIHLFRATGLTHTGRPDGTEEGEDIEVEWMDMEEAVAATRDGRIQDSKSALGILLAAGTDGRADGRSG